MISHGGSTLIALLKREWFIIALVGVVGGASLVPCYATGARIGQWLAAFAISSLFFLQGARLSRSAWTPGPLNWPLPPRLAPGPFGAFIGAVSGRVGGVQYPAAIDADRSALPLCPAVDGAVVGGADLDRSRQCRRSGLRGHRIQHRRSRRVADDAGGIIAIARRIDRARWAVEDPASAIAAVCRRAFYA